MTNEQTAIMLQGLLDGLLPTWNKVRVMPIIMPDGQEVTGGHEVYDGLKKHLNSLIDHIQLLKSTDYAHVFQGPSDIERIGD